MASRGHALSRDALIRTLTAYSGITTEDGELDGTTLVDTNLIDNPRISPSGIPEKTVLIMSGDARGEDKGSASFNNVTGAITLQGTGFSDQIKAGTIFRILNISSIEIDVANIDTKIGTNTDPAGTTTLFAWLLKLFEHGGQGLVYYGEVTQVDLATQFRVADLAGFGDAYFADTYRVFVVRDAAGLGAAPQGEMQPSTAYTSVGGIFTHPAFTAGLVVGDEVLLIHERIAEIADLVAALGQMDDAATSDDLSDITTTSALAKLRRLLLRFSPGAFSVSIDGSDRTDLDALYTALGVLLGTRDATVSAGVLADTESALALLRRIATAGPVMLFGDITGYTDLENFVVADFIGWEDNFFKGWSAYLVRDDGGAGAIPQGSRVTIQAYTSTTGALVTSALSAAGAIGDQIMLVHPILMDAWNLRGGVETLESLDDELDAVLDIARGSSGAVSVDGGEDNLYNESHANEFVLLELRVDLHNMQEGDTIIFKVYTTEDGTERKISDDAANTFTGAQDPARVEIIGSANQVWGREGIRVCAVKTEGVTREVTAFYRDAKRGT